MADMRSTTAYRDHLRHQSLLGRLHLYGRGEEVSPTENFTTEALAGAARSNPRPLIAALGRADPRVPTEPPWTVSAVVTQEAVAGVGIIDMTIEGRDRLGPFEYLLEVKIWAGEHGDQLSRYARHVAAPSRARRALIAVGPGPLQSDVSIHRLSWRQIWTAIDAETGPEDRLWHDLQRFLVEIKMADDASEPITSKEAASLSAASGLVRKVAHALWRVAASWQESYPRIWPAGQGYVRRIIARELADNGRLTIEVGLDGMPLAVILGAVDDADEVYAVAWVETRSRRSPIVDQIRQQVEAGAFANEWSGSLDGTVLLRKKGRIVALQSADDLFSWFDASLTELQSMGVLAAMQQAHQSTPPDIEPTPS